MALDPMTDGLTRTNPNAHEPENALQLYGVGKVGCCDFAAEFTWAVGGTLADPTLVFTPTAGANDPDLRYFKWKVLDQSGNAAFGATVPPATTPVTVNVSGLNLTDPLRVEFRAEKTGNSGPCIVCYWVEVPAGYVNAMLSPEAGEGA